jgi:hypothetical protein
MGATYDIIAERCTSDLVDKVQEFLSSGWVLRGDPYAVVSINGVEMHYQCITRSVQKLST